MNRQERAVRYLDNFAVTVGCDDFIHYCLEMLVHGDSFNYYNKLPTETVQLLYQIYKDCGGLDE